MGSSMQVEGLAFGRSRDASSGKIKKKKMSLEIGNNNHHYH